MIQLLYKVSRLYGNVRGEIIQLQIAGLFLKLANYGCLLGDDDRKNLSPSKFWSFSPPDIRDSLFVTPQPKFLMILM